MGTSSGFSNVSAKKIHLSVLFLGIFLPLTKNVEFLPPPTWNLLKKNIQDEHQSISIKKNRWNRFQHRKIPEAKLHFPGFCGFYLPTELWGMMGNSICPMEKNGNSGVLQAPQPRLDPWSDPNIIPNPIFPRKSSPVVAILNNFVEKFPFFSLAPIPWNRKIPQHRHRLRSRTLE